jgi:hypothetical protein
MDLFEDNKNIITSTMIIEEKIAFMFDYYKLNDFIDSNDLCCIFRVQKGGIAYIHIVSTHNLWDTMTQLYNGFGADLVDILRLVNVRLSNCNWERSDFISEIYSCIEEFQLRDLPYGFYQYAKEKELLEFFDYKLSIESFNFDFVFQKNLEIKFERIITDPHYNDPHNSENNSKRMRFSNEI